MRAAEENLLRGALARTTNIREAAAVLGVTPKVVRSRCRKLGVLPPGTQSSRMLTIGGVTKSVTEWAIEKQIPREVVFQRLRRGWKVDGADPGAILRPSRDYKRKKEA